MKTHTVTVDFEPNGEFRLRYADTRCGVVCLLDRFAQHWGVTPSVRERDVANLAAAIYAADRIVRRGRNENDTARFIQLRVGVIDNASIEADSIEHLCRLLGFLSGDEWDISLLETANPPPLPVQQRLTAGQPPRSRVCLYSGGLDSASGLALRRQDSSEPWLAVNVGHQNGIRHRSKQQIKAHLRFNDHHLQLVPLIARLGRAPRADRQESSQRARGLLFCAAAALAAKWSRVNQIEVFENGVGAFNLPLMTGMLHGGRSTRGAHPRFLAEIGPWLGRTLNHPLSYTLPFSWQTKAEMLQRLPREQALALVKLSHSCVHTSIRKTDIDHCGVCPACIERQKDIASAGLSDQSDRYEKRVGRFDNSLPEKAKHYIQFRRWRARGVIGGSYEYQSLRNDYWRATQLHLGRVQRHEFNRLMRRDARECLAWQAAAGLVSSPDFNPQRAVDYEH